MQQLTTLFLSYQKQQMFQYVETDSHQARNPLTKNMPDTIVQHPKDTTVSRCGYTNLLPVACQGGRQLHKAVRYVPAGLRCRVS